MQRLLLPRGTHCSPTTAGHALLPDRFMGALCEPTRCRPSTAHSWLLNQQHPDKTWGDALSWDHRARQGYTGDPSHSTRSTHLPLPVPGCSRIRRAARGSGCPQPSVPSEAEPPPCPSALCSANPRLSHVFHGRTTAPAPN